MRKLKQNGRANPIRETYVQTFHQGRADFIAFDRICPEKRRIGSATKEQVSSVSSHSMISLSFEIPSKATRNTVGWEIVWLRAVLHYTMHAGKCLAPRVFHAHRARFVVHVASFCPAIKSRGGLRYDYYPPVTRYPTTFADIGSHWSCAGIISQGILLVLQRFVAFCMQCLSHPTLG